MGTLCDNTPKPLLKIKGRPMLHWILERMRAAGVECCHLAVRYHAAKIIDRFGKEFDGMPLNYLVENDALGTAGALALLPAPAPVLVSNGDLFTDTAFSEIAQHHEQQQADATICAAHTRLPYGVIGWPSSTDVIAERPTVQTNAGMYCLSQNVVRGAMMSSAHKQNMPDLINRVAGFGGRVAVYPVTGAWSDVAAPADLERINA